MNNPTPQPQVQKRTITVDIYIEPESFPFPTFLPSVPSVTRIRASRWRRSKISEIYVDVTEYDKNKLKSDLHEFYESHGFTVKRLVIHDRNR